MRFGILFPDDLAKELGSAVQDLYTDAKSFSKLLGFLDQAIELIATASGNQLTTASQSLAQGENERQELQKWLERFKIRMDELARRISNYLRIDDVAAEFRGPVPPPK